MEDNKQNQDPSQDQEATRELPLVRVPAPPPKKPFQLDISFDDDDLADAHTAPEDVPAPKGEVYFSNPPAPPAPAKPAKPEKPPLAKRKKKRRRAFSSMTLLALVCLAVSAVLSFVGISTLRDILAIGKNPKKATEVHIVIPNGQTTDQVIDILADNHLVSQRQLCKLYARFTFKITSKGKKNKKPPEYLAAPYAVDSSLGLEEMLDSFKERPRTNETVKLAFPEGFTTKKIMKKISDNRVTTAIAIKNMMTVAGVDFEYPFLTALKDAGKARRFYPYEGYLFPDTYEFYVNENVNSVLKRFFENFQGKWVVEYDARAKELGMTVDDVVTLASIIQKEAANKDQMADVSSVLHNRLNNPSQFRQLECDSTRDYVLNNIATEMDAGAVTYYDDIYNTYKCVGLPVGPICSPGVDAIEAALYPKATNYFFFQHDKKGKIYLSKTRAEHDRVKTDLVIKGLNQ